MAKLTNIACKNAKPTGKTQRPKTRAPEYTPILEDRLYIRINEARQIMGSASNGNTLKQKILSVCLRKLPRNSCCTG